MIQTFAKRAEYTLSFFYFNNIDQKFINKGKKSNQCSSKILRTI